MKTLDYFLDNKTSNKTLLTKTRLLFNSFFYRISSINKNCVHCICIPFRSTGAFPRSIFTTQKMRVRMRKPKQLTLKKTSLILALFRSSSNILPVELKTYTLKALERKSESRTIFQQIFFS